MWLEGGLASGGMERRTPDKGLPAMRANVVDGSHAGGGKARIFRRDLKNARGGSFEPPRAMDLLKGETWVGAEKGPQSGRAVPALPLEFGHF